MRFITTNSVWALVIFVIILAGLGLGVLTLYQSEISIIGWIWLVTGLTCLLWLMYIYTNAKNNAIEYFSACPICGSSNILAKISWGLSIDDTHEVICQDCGAKWIIKTSGWTGKIKTVKLVKPSDNDAGQEYLGKETDPEFWVTIARKRKQK